MALATATATASEADSKYPVKQVSYSTGAHGAKLTWLPYRPTAKDARRAKSESGVAQAQYQSSAASRGAVVDDPVKDPFGDRLAASPRTTGPTLKSGGNLLHSMKGQLDPPDPPAAPQADEETVTETTPGQPNSLPLLWVNNRAKKTKALTAKEDMDLPAIPTPEKRDVPSLEDELATNMLRSADDCPPSGQFKPIYDISNDITAKKGKFPRECPIKKEIFQPRAWAPTTYTWKASGFCHKPLYFEEVQLERYGHSWGPYLQPVISQGHFFLTVPVLPYMMGLNPPNECLYTLGYYRPGSCAPYILDPLPISVRAGLLQAGAVTGAAFLVP